MIPMSMFLQVAVDGEEKSVPFHGVLVDGGVFFLARGFEDDNQGSLTYRPGADRWAVIFAFAGIALFAYAFASRDVAMALAARINLMADWGDPARITRAEQRRIERELEEAKEADRKVERHAMETWL